MKYSRKINQLPLGRLFQHANGAGHRQAQAKRFRPPLRLVQQDRISLQFRAFAEGAVRAAEWLMGKKGFYDFKDVWRDL